jgi:hypothetical protein
MLPVLKNGGFGLAVHWEKKTFSGGLKPFLGAFYKLSLS